MRGEMEIMTLIWKDESFVSNVSIIAPVIEIVLLKVVVVVVGVVVIVVVVVVAVVVVVVAVAEAAAAAAVLGSLQLKDKLKTQSPTTPLVNTFSPSVWRKHSACLPGPLKASNLAKDVHLSEIPTPTPLPHNKHNDMTRVTKNWRYIFPPRSDSNPKQTAFLDIALLYLQSPVCRAYKYQRKHHRTYYISIWLRQKANSSRRFNRSPTGLSTLRQRSPLQTDLDLYLYTVRYGVVCAPKFAQVQDVQTRPPGLCGPRWLLASLKCFTMIIRGTKTFTVRFHCVLSSSTTQTLKLHNNSKHHIEAQPVH
ncbi:hypothetical protein ElyMa_001182400 [Elysia marginata]|uniref:Uncharacterized protein n=1 Tax=Elysia marginata TaxID=1093978 RepID=A0AAV4I5F0_9GAST|nr:hypothetical protein ElyMa_001182400 [Elysia marginata]